MSLDYWSTGGSSTPESKATAEEPPSDDSHQWAPPTPSPFAPKATKPWPTEVPASADPWEGILVKPGPGKRYAD
jgi:hypothetical protein